MSLEQDSVSIIIVTHNSLPILEKSIRSILAAGESASRRLIVVDNGSTDKSISTVSELVPEARIIRNESNRGFGAACNQAAAASDSKYLLFVNPDLEIDPGAIDALAAFLGGKEKGGAVAGRLRYPDGRFQANCRMLPDRTNIFLSRGSILSRLFTGGSSYTVGDNEEACSVPAVAGTFMMIDRSVFVAVGGFDERFFMYMEDTDLSARLFMNGYTNYFVPDAGAVHHWGCGSKAGALRRSWMHHRSVWNYYLKHFPDGYSVILLPLLLLANFLFRAIVPGPDDGKG